MAEPYRIDAQLLRKVEELAQALAESEPVQAWHRSRQALQEHEAARRLLEDFARLRQELENKQRAGQRITREEVTQLQRAFDLAMHNPYVREMLDAQAAVMQLFDVISQVLAQAAGILPEVEAEEGDQPQEAPATTADPAAPRPGAARPGPTILQPGAGAVPGAAPGGQGAPKLTTVRSKLWVPPGTR